MAKKEIAEHVLLCARKLYEETDTPSATISRLMDVSASTLARHAVRNGWTPRAGLRLRQHQAAAPFADIAVLGARIRSTVDREIAEAERQLNKPGPRAARMAGSERAARTLANLTRTLNELKRLEAGDSESTPKAEDDEIDIDEFRRDVARRLEALCAEEESR